MYHKKNDKRSKQSCEWIYEALCELLKEKDFSNITVTDVVNKANIGRTTFYRNFDTLEDVLRFKCDEAFDGLQEYLNNYYRSLALAQRDQKGVFIKPFLRYWYLDSFIIELLIKINRIDIIQSTFTKVIEMYIEKISDPTAGSILQHKEYFIAIRTGIAINILLKWMGNGKNIPPDDLADMLIVQMEETTNLSLLI